MSVDTAEASRFLTAMFGSAPGVIGLSWTAGTGLRSKFFADVAEAVAHVERIEESSRPQGIYARMTTLATPPASGRGGAEDSHALVCLWADLDFGDTGHHHDPAKHEGHPLPPDAEGARKVVDAAGLPKPTLWVHSGGGLYPLWLVREPHLLGDDRAEVAALSAGWQEALAVGAASLGWHYGAGVGDLARILRLPGTTNRKAGQDRSCRVVEAGGPRYGLDELRAALVALRPAEGDPAGEALSAPAWSPGGAFEDTGPFDVLAEVAAWADVLGPAEWTFVRHERDGAELWLRPGGTSEYSLRAGGRNGAVAVVHSTDAGLPVGAGQRLTKGRLFAHLWHGGDESAAARDLLRAAGHAEASEAARGLPAPVLGAIRERCHVAGWAAPDVSRASFSATDAADEATARALKFHRQVADEADKIRVRAAAAKLVRSESTAVPEAEFVALGDFLAVPDEPARFRVDGLWPLGGRVVLAAAYKAGKSTLRDNLVRSLVDGDTFLGRFAVPVTVASVALIDDELDPRMLRRWLREQGIRNTRAVHVLSLRGRVSALDLTDVDTRARWAAELRKRGVEVVILDCLRPVLDALGLSEDKDAGRFLVGFDALLDEAGVREGLVIHHAGHSGERSRGDSRLRDWPDVEWRLVRQAEDNREADADARRFFSAYGRDVSVPEGLISFDPTTRRLGYAGGTRREADVERGLPLVEAFLKDHPDSSQRAVEAGLKGSLGRDKARAALALAISRGLVVATWVANKNARLHSLSAGS